jgi:hypothetical protein
LCRRSFSGIAQPWHVELLPEFGQRGNDFVIPSGVAGRAFLLGTIWNRNEDKLSGHWIDWRIPGTVGMINSDANENCLPQGFFMIAGSGSDSSYTESGSDHGEGIH